MKKYNKFFEKIQILIVILIYLFLTDFTCLIKYFTGFPCPACGMTRAYKSLLNFDLHSAFYYHPLFWFIPPILIFIIVSDKPLFKSSKKQAIFYAIVFIIIFAVYIYRMIHLFPSTAPLDYSKKSIAYNIYSHLKVIFFNKINHKLI